MTKKEIGNKKASDTLKKLWKNEEYRKSQSEKLKGKNKGKIPWLKGLTKETDKRVENMGKSISKSLTKYLKTHSRRNKNCRYRKDLGHLCRSNPEANFARILKYLKIEYEYEKVFKLSNSRRYMMDFYISSLNLGYEFKGWLTEQAKQKYSLFNKDYPDIKFIIVMQKSNEWRRLRKYFKDKILAWEE